MKSIGITQRIVRFPDYSESRDCLDRRWLDLIATLNYVALPLPNISPRHVSALLDNLDLGAVIFSGGNSVTVPGVTCDDLAPERDAFEGTLLEAAFSRNLPIFGVCRGLQMINVHLGGQLRLIPGHGHAGTRHGIRLLEVGDYRLPEMVNSYHDWAIPAEGLADGLLALAHDDDGNIEAFVHESMPIVGIMWHPERETPFSPLDLDLMRKVFR